MRSRYVLLLCPLTTFLLLALHGCATPDMPPVASTGAVLSSSTVANSEVVVFAATSLNDAFSQLADDLKESGAISEATYNFAGSQTLAAQLAQGAQADVFASADEKTMQAAVEAGRVLSGTQQVLATNSLIVIVPPNADGKVTALQDLAKPGIKLDLAAPSVPAGSYSLQLLDKLSADPQYGPDFKSKVLENVVSREDNVRQVLTKVLLGEADAGIVYVTDTKASGSSPDDKQVGTIRIGNRHNVTARYYIAPIIDSPNPEAARRFIEYALSKPGQQTLQSFGFGTADEER